MKKNMSGKYLLKVIFLISALFYGCGSTRTESLKFVCPVVKQNCSAGQWTGVPYDTSSEVTKNLKDYYVFEPVKQINSPNDEWCLSFLSPSHAALTFNDEGQQKTMLVRMLEANLGSMESGIGIPLEGSVGSFFFRNNDAFFAAALSEDIPGFSKIYSGKLNGNVLSDVKPLSDAVNEHPVVWKSQPALSPDGNVLFFASDKLMDSKGTDIWFSVKQADGEWSTPINCGDNINSRCDEITPFVTKDGKKLLFSSSGHETVGGYDIFWSDISPAFWVAARNHDFEALKNTRDFFGEAKNFGTPLNTKADEIFPTSGVDIDSLLYYSSNQDAGNANNLILRQGGFDIFVRRKVVNIKNEPIAIKKHEVIKVPDAKEKKIETPTVIPDFTLEGHVYNQHTKEPVPNADVSVKEIPENGTTKDTKTDNNGKYNIKLDKNKEYQILAQARNLFYTMFSLRIGPTDTVTRVNKDIYIPEELTLRINFPTDKWNSPYQYILDSNGVETNEYWEKELDVLADNIKQSQELIERITFVGHTDDVASVEYNKQLGKRRVDFIIEQLVQRGVPAKLLEGHSAGKSELLEQGDGEDIQIWRKRCRRVELRKVLKVN
ncbi:MAG: carboxypeptidase regulatory-like domain-containing protein [FCB group bacterium]